MRHGFVKVAAATPDIRVADVEFNTEKICEGDRRGVREEGEDHRSSRSCA